MIWIVLLTWGAAAQAANPANQQQGPQWIEATSILAKIPPGPATVQEALSRQGSFPDVGGHLRPGDVRSGAAQRELSVDLQLQGSLFFMAPEAPIPGKLSSRLEKKMRELSKGAMQLSQEIRKVTDEFSRAMGSARTELDDRMSAINGEYHPKMEALGCVGPGGAQGKCLPLSQDRHQKLLEAKGAFLKKAVVSVRKYREQGGQILTRGEALDQGIGKALQKSAAAPGATPILQRLHSDELLILQSLVEANHKLTTVAAASDQAI